MDLQAVLGKLPGNLHWLRCSAVRDLVRIVFIVGHGLVIGDYLIEESVRPALSLLIGKDNVHLLARISAQIHDIGSHIRPGAARSHAGKIGIIKTVLLIISNLGAVCKIYMHRHCVSAHAYGTIGGTRRGKARRPDSPRIPELSSIGPDTPCVASDNFAGGQLAAEKLANLGCKNVAFLRTGASLTNEPNKRKAGFENGCLSRNLTYEMKIINDGDSYKEFDTFLEEHIQNGRLTFEGIFCVTDGLANYILQVLRRLNQRVPEDVQVIGFDGTCNPGTHDYICSTIVQPVADIAEMCTELLLQENMAVKPPLVCLPVTYAYGGTTADPSGF